MDLWVSWWQLVFLLSLTYPYIQAGYPSNPRLWFERKNVFRYLLYNSQYKKKSPSGGLRGDSFFPIPVHASAAFLVDSTGMVWEFGQTCEAAGNGIKRIFFFTVLSVPFSKHPHHRNPSPSDPTNIKLLIPAFKISPCITGTFHTCSPNKEVI